METRSLLPLLLVPALGCGGKLMDIPDSGYLPIGEDGGVETVVGGEDGGASQGSGGGSGSSSSGTTGVTGSGSSSSGTTTSSGSSGGAAGPCGGQTCGRGEVCCVDTGGGRDGGAGSQACSAQSACKGLALTCGSAADCSAGDVCCVAINLAGALGGGAVSGSSTCEATCPSGSGQLCASSAECPKGVTCQNTGMGGSICGGIQSLLGGLGGGTGGTGGTGGGLGGLLCAHPATPIATPDGERPIASLHVGDMVMSLDHGQVKAVPIVRVNRSPAPNHHVVSATLDSGRTLHISEGHPTADGRLFRDLVPGDRLGDARVVSLESIPYDADATYDVLPASDTGAYFAAGALVGSTLFR